MESRVGEKEPLRAPPRREVVDVSAAAPQSAAPRPSRRRAVALAAVAVTALAGTVYWLDARRFEETDDAQVDGDIANLSPRIAGTVKTVHVLENELVRRGQLLVELDPADMEAAAAEARAALAAAAAELEAENPTVSMTETSNRAALTSSVADLASARAAAAEARKSVEQIAAQLAQAEANDRTAQLERRRAETLMAGLAVSQSDLDQRVNAAAASGANVESMRHALDAARERASAQEAHVATLESRATEVRSNAPRQLEAR